MIFGMGPLTVAVQSSVVSGRMFGAGHIRRAIYDAISSKYLATFVVEG